MGHFNVELVETFCLFPALEGFGCFAIGCFFVFVSMALFSGELPIEGGSPEGPNIFWLTW
jgi:hypothetical protein